MVISSSFEELLAKANSGNHNAQYRCGLIFLEGRSHKQDLRKAIEFFSKASEGNHADATVALGKFSASGRVVDKDPAKAFELFQRAAAHGSVLGKFESACLLQSGRGTDQDQEAAFKLFHECATNDPPLADACHRLRQCFKRGIGIGREESQAFIWAQKGAELGDKRCMLALGQLLCEGFAGNKDDDMAPDLTGGLKLYIAAANLGDREAMYRAGYMYATGLGRDIDAVTARFYLERAAALGHTKALFMTGDLLAKDNKPLALAYFEAAQKRGHDDAAMRINELVAQGVESVGSLPSVQAVFRRCRGAGAAAALSDLQALRTTKPDPIVWNEADVLTWLGGVSTSLLVYSGPFKDSAVNGTVLLDLQDSDLEEVLGVEDRLHRRRILSAIEALKVYHPREVTEDDHKEAERG